MMEIEISISSTDSDLYFISTKIDGHYDKIGELKYNIVNKTNLLITYLHLDNQFRNSETLKVFFKTLFLYNKWVNVFIGRFDNAELYEKIGAVLESNRMFRIERDRGGD